MFKIICVYIYIYSPISICVGVLVVYLLCCISVACMISPSAPANSCAQARQTVMVGSLPLRESGWSHHFC